MCSVELHLKNQPTKIIDEDRLFGFHLISFGKGNYKKHIDSYRKRKE